RLPQRNYRNETRWRSCPRGQMERSDSVGIAPTRWRMRRGHVSAMPTLRRPVTPMLKQIGRRLATVIPSLIGVIIVTFLLTRVLPGDAAAYFAGPAASAQAIEEVRKQLGLDKSLPEQFIRYVTDLAHGDLGKSLTTGQSVTADIAARLPASAE